MNPYHDYGVPTSYELHAFFVFSLRYSYYATHMIKKFEMNLIFILPKIIFGHTHISVLEIGIIMLKTACINLIY